MCKRNFTSLLQHIAKWSECGQKYSQDDLNDIRSGIKIISNENRKDRDQKDYYQENKEKFAERYQANKEAIVIDRPRENDNSTKASEIMPSVNENEISTTKIDTVSSVIYFSTFFLFNITFILYYVSIKNH